MSKILNALLREQSGEGILTGMLWLAVTAIVAGSIAVSVWSAISGSSDSIINLIINTFK